MLVEVSADPTIPRMTLGMIIVMMRMTMMLMMRHHFLFFIKSSTQPEETGLVGTSPTWPGFDADSTFCRTSTTGRLGTMEVYKYNKLEDDVIL